MRLLTLSLLADIPLVFGTHWEFRGNSTELEWQTSFSMEGDSGFPSTIITLLELTWARVLGLICGRLIEGADGWAGSHVARVQLR